MDIDELRIDIEARIQNAKDDHLPRTCCIYKVPRSIREQNEYIYTPTTISIGPFHYGDPRFKDMERCKMVMLKRFTKRVCTRLDNLISFVSSLEPMVRASYSEDTLLTEKEFQKLMLVDGAFIIELFVSCYDGISMDAPLLQPRVLSDITKDLFLLENQLPFFFLKELYKVAFPASDIVPSLIDLSYMFFASFNIQHLEPSPDVRINHFTDLLRLFHLPTSLPPRVSFEGLNNNILLYSAKQLAEVDIKFKVRMQVSPLDLKFSSGILEVPRILVDNKTLIFFHNMITFEQCHYSFHHYLCDYAVLLDCLINSHEDVNVLIRHGIIHNLGDPSDVIRIFDGLSTNLTLMSFNSDYSWISHALNSFRRDPWHQVKPALRRQLLLSITGFVLNMLTLVQTIFSILQVVWH